MTSTLDLGGLQIELTRKAIKHVHLSVMPPAGQVRVAAPAHVPLETIRLFVIAKLAWIRQQQAKLHAQRREGPRRYSAKESHYVWGKRCLLQLTLADAAPVVTLRPRTLHLQVRPGTDAAGRDALLQAWYRQQVREATVAMLAHWQPVMGVQARQLRVQRMKTKWGSCTPSTGDIRLNTELAKKPRECLEYVLVHELAHLLEPSHNDGFVALMDRFLPAWRQLRKRLNSLPLRHEDWAY